MLGKRPAGQVDHSAPGYGSQIWVCVSIRIKHGFSYINIRQVPWEVLKPEAKGRGFQHPKGPGEC